MKGSRFTEEQIIGILREQEARAGGGREGGGCVPRARSHRRREIGGVWRSQFYTELASRTGFEPVLPT